VKFLRNLLRTENHIFSFKIFFRPFCRSLDSAALGIAHPPLPATVTALQSCQVYDRHSDRIPTLLTNIFRAFLQPFDVVLELSSIFLITGRNNFLPSELARHCKAEKESNTQETRKVCPLCKERSIASGTLVPIDETNTTYHHSHPMSV
jgi:hypothetical protein